MLGQYLDYQRETMLSKTDGLTQEQLALKHAPSELTLAGLLYHLALVEEDWMEVRFSGLPDREPWVDVDWDADPDWEFRTACQLKPDDLRRRYRQACERSREAAAEAVGLDQLSVRPLRNGERFSLRWVLLHLIEETARHAWPCRLPPRIDRRQSRRVALGTVLEEDPHSRWLPPPCEIRRSERLAASRADLLGARLSGHYVLPPGSAFVFGGCIR